MRSLLKAVVIGCSLGFAAGCQAYDFQQVDPLAVSQTTQSEPKYGRALKPNLMLLVDKSGSMYRPTDPNDSRCVPMGCENGSCPPGCPTRITELKSAMSTFLGQYGNVARFGLATFPVGSSPAEQCVGTQASGIAEGLPAASLFDPADGPASEYQVKANAINAKIQAISPGGGTPTGESLKNVGLLAGLRDPADNRDDFIVLLTDGLPNCNAANVTNNCSGANAACICTLTNSCNTAATCSIGCLDRSGVVERIQDLRTAGIRTIVVGFGADTAAGDAPATLNAMAAAGGFARACPNGTDAECGSGNACLLSTKVCRSQFYQAANGAELGKALADISIILQRNTACTVVLDSQPTQSELVAVKVDGVTQAPGENTWGLESGKVLFKGLQCEALKNATVASPVRVEVKVVEKL